MTAERRRVLAWGVLFACLLGAAGWSYRGMATASRHAALAAEELAACEAAVATIESLRQRPAIAGSQEMQLTEMARRIESAAAGAEIGLDRVVRVWPEPARRVGDSPYQEKPTQVLLRGVTLQQLTGFLVAVTSDDAGLRVKHVRLSTPREATAGRGAEAGSRNEWMAETTLTYLLYAPPEAEGTRVTKQASIVE